MFFSAEFEPSGHKSRIIYLTENEANIARNALEFLGLKFESSNDPHGFYNYTTHCILLPSFPPKTAETGFSVTFNPSGFADLLAYAQVYAKNFYTVYTGKN